MTCISKRKHNCGTNINATCVIYEGYLPEDSELLDEGCVVIEETTEELYKMVEEIEDNIDLSDLGNSCIDYEEEEVGEIKVKEALVKFEEEICDIKDQLENLPSDTTGINVDNIDTSCLVDPCGTGLNSPDDILQAIITKLCELQDIVNNL